MKNSLDKRFWIWGQFDQESADALNLIHKKVNEVFMGPFFGVHITISGPLVSLDQDIIDRFLSLPEKLRPIEIIPEKYSFTDEEKRSLFIDIQKTVSLMNLKRDIDLEFNITDLNYRPHISLFYGEESAKHKKELISKLPELLHRIKLNRLSLVRTDLGVDRWRIEKEVFL